MALYFYRALSKSGKKTTGYIDSPTEEAVRAGLIAKNLYPVEISIKKENSSSFIKNLLEKPVPAKDLIMFTKQFSTLLSSGVPLAESLDLLSGQFSGKLKSIIVNIKDEIKGGKSLADGLADYPKTFSNIYVQLVRAGEATGKLDTILKRLTVYIERQDETKRKVSKALSGPLIQLAMIGAIVVGIIAFVIPGLESMLKASGKELPWNTKILMASSDLLQNHYMAIITTILAITISVQYWISQKSGRRFLDRVKLKLPLVKYFTQMNAIIQFSQTLGMLIESGVTLSEALTIVCDIVDNSILSETLEEAKDKIVKQGKITPFLKETGIFPPMAIYLINTGEQSGNLDSMLLTVAKNYESELIDLTDNLTTNLNPFITLVMGGVVGFIMMSIMGPNDEYVSNVNL